MAMRLDCPLRRGHRGAPPMLPVTHVPPRSQPDERVVRCCGQRVWFVRDICGVICALLTWGLVLYAQYVVVGVILYPNLGSPYATAHFILFEALAFLAVVSHVRTMVTDPVSSVPTPMWAFFGIEMGWIGVKQWDPRNYTIIRTNFKMVEVKGGHFKKVSSSSEHPKHQNLDVPGH